MELRLNVFLTNIHPLLSYIGIDPNLIKITIILTFFADISVNSTN